MIYYVEDDDSIRELVVYTLNQMGMETQGFTCGDEFWPAMEKKTAGIDPAGCNAAR